MGKVKDIYNEQFINQLTKTLKKSSPDFNGKEFQEAVYLNDWESLEFKQRVRRISTAMFESLPKTYEEVIDIFYQTAPSFGGLAGIIFPDYVEQYGLNDWEKSMEALEFFTPFSTSEFAVRPFFIIDQERMMRQMFNWAQSKNEHVRRLASEGSRPRLPWGSTVPSFKENPLQFIPMLESLLQDDSLYVRKSVANHLNDISRIHPTAITKIVEKWQGKDQRTDWILRHASRSLLKQGNRDILALFGYKASNKLQIRNLSLNKAAISIGEELLFSFDLAVETGTKVRLEYAIDYVKNNGNQNRKVFQITETVVEDGLIKSFSRKQSFKNMTTRKHYPGVHMLHVLVNGEVKASKDFFVN
jgi:3-methyladenine DNA glycosylase AlkC